MGVVIVEGERGSFGSEFGASRCNQWGTLLCSCARATHSSQMTLEGLIYFSVHIFCQHRNIEWHDVSMQKRPNCSSGDFRRTVISPINALYWNWWDCRHVMWKGGKAGIKLSWLNAITLPRSDATHQGVPRRWRERFSRVHWELYGNVEQLHHIRPMTDGQTLLNTR